MAGAGVVPSPEGGLIKARLDRFGELAQPGGHPSSARVGAHWPRRQVFVAEAVNGWETTKLSIPINQNPAHRI